MWNIFESVPMKAIIIMTMFAYNLNSKYKLQPSIFNLPKLAFIIFKHDLFDADQKSHDMEQQLEPLFQTFNV